MTSYHTPEHENVPVDYQPCLPGSSYASACSHSPFWSQGLSLLEEALHPPQPDYATLADQVFGSQARRERLSLQQLTHLLYDRGLLHKKHLCDIDHRHMDCQERLFIARELSPNADSRQQASLERLLVQLEKDKRDEELGFWKDTLTLRQELLEKAGEYRATRDRWQHLGSLEVNYG